MPAGGTHTASHPLVRRLPKAGCMEQRLAQNADFLPTVNYATAQFSTACALDRINNVLLRRSTLRRMAPNLSALAAIGTMDRGACDCTLVRPGVTIC